MRTAVDTNILVRLLTDDDQTQSATARALAEEGGEFVISATVVLETAWVLRTIYRYTPARIDAGFSALLSRPQMVFGDEYRVLQALEFARLGMDFADALYLAGAADCDEFVPFDRDLARRAAATADAVPIRLL